MAAYRARPVLLAERPLEHLLLRHQVEPPYLEHPHQLLDLWPDPLRHQGLHLNLDAALGVAMDQATDQGAGAGAPDMGVPPDAGAADAPMDAPPEAPDEPDMPPPDDPIV